MFDVSYKKLVSNNCESMETFHVNSKFKDKYIFKSNNKGKRYFPTPSKTSSGVQYIIWGWYGV